MIEPSFFSKLDAMSLTLKRQSFGKYSGEQKTTYAGDGLTFRDYSPYTLGDDFRKIDWKVFARTKELFIRRYEADKNLTIHILIDTSASMGYTRGHSKFDYAAMMALGVAHVTLKNQEKVEISTFSEKLLTLKRQNQQESIQKLVHVFNKLKPKKNGDFSYIMRQYKQRVTSKSLIFIVSDFLYPPEQLKVLLSLYSRSQVFLVQMLHKDEVALPFEGDTKFIDPEEESESVRAYVTPSLQRTYQKELIKHSMSIRHSCGINTFYVQLDTRDSPIHSFMKLWETI